MSVALTTPTELIAQAEFDERIKEMRKTYGLLPMCRKCGRECVQYAAPGLVRFVCERTPGYEDERRRMGAE